MITRSLASRLLSVLISIWMPAAFAQDANLAASPRPTTLPAKKSSNSKTEPRSESVTSTKVSSRVGARATKSRKVVTRPLGEKSSAVARTLPAKTKVVMNFDRPSLPSTEGVVVRDESATSPPPLNDVETVQRRDVKEAASVTIQDGALTARTLRPALPDSDSFVELPPGLVHTPPPQTGVRLTARPPTPTPAPTPALPVALAPAFVTPAATAPPAPAPATVPTLPAPTAPSVAQQPEVDYDLNLQTTTLPAEPTAMAIDTTTHESIRQEQASKSTSVADFVGPLAPLVNTQARVDIVRTETEALVDHEKGTRGDSYETHVAPAIATTFLIPHDETPKRRIFIRGGYLNAKYDRLEPDLRNGATTLGVSASQVFSQTEVRIGIDIAHGLDQEVSLRNTRMAIFRAEGLYTILTHSLGTLYVGGAIGAASIDVNSYRQASGSDITIRENAKGSALLAAPEIGARIKIGRQLSLDLTLQYLLLAGSDQISNLGGLLGEAALGFRF